MSPRLCRRILGCWSWWTTDSLKRCGKWSQIRTYRGNYVFVVGCRRIDETTVANHVVKWYICAISFAKLPAVSTHVQSRSLTMSGKLAEDFAVFRIAEEGQVARLQVILTFPIAQRLDTILNHYRLWVVKFKNWLANMMMPSGILKVSGLRDVLRSRTQMSRAPNTKNCSNLWYDLMFITVYKTWPVIGAQFICSSVDRCRCWFVHRM